MRSYLTELSKDLLPAALLVAVVMFVVLGVSLAAVVMFVLAVATGVAVGFGIHVLMQHGHRSPGDGRLGPGHA